MDWSTSSSVQAKNWWSLRYDDVSVHIRVMVSERRGLALEGCGRRKEMVSSVDGRKPV